MEKTLKKLREALVPVYGKNEAEGIIRLIFHHVKGWNLTDMLIHQKDELSDFVKNEIKIILERLLTNEPIQYILGEARFHGMDLKIHPGVLIPRRETEELVDIIIDDNSGREDLKVLDLCSGSGCIAISLARNLPFSKVTGLDFSTEAITTAKENSELLKTKINLIQEDIFEFSPEDSFDIIVSNPPYVMDKEALKMERNVLDYEPHEAIFVRDDDPLVFYKRIVEIAKRNLARGGKIYLEINPLTSRNLENFVINNGFEDVELMRDSFGRIRLLKAKLS